MMNPKRVPGRRAPHPALDRRVESGGRDLLWASFVAPGARRGPGHAAGRHKKAKRERVFFSRSKESEGHFFFPSSSLQKNGCRNNCFGRFDLFSLLSPSVFLPYYDLQQHASGARQCLLPRQRLCEHVVLSAGGDDDGKESSAAQAACRRRRCRRRCCIEVRFAALLSPLCCPFRCSEA